MSLFSIANARIVLKSQIIFFLVQNENYKYNEDVRHETKSTCQSNNVSRWGNIHDSQHVPNKYWKLIQSSNFGIIDLVTALILVDISLALKNSLAKLHIQLKKKKWPLLKSEFKVKQVQYFLSVSEINLQLSKCYSRFTDLGTSFIIKKFLISAN